MKAAYLEHDGKIFALYDSQTKEKVMDINPGTIDGDIDWDLVDNQAQQEGYTIFTKEG